jgi:GTPase KRas
LSAAVSAGLVLVMLIRNKSDSFTEHKVSTQEGYALARKLGFEFVKASAKNSTNVEKAFYDIVRLLRRQL